jgi:amidohydrolase
MDIKPWSELVDEGISRYWDSLIATRRHIHAHPELSFEEVDTTNYLAQQLDEASIPYRRGPLDTGLVVDIGGGRRVLGLRADIDAITVQEETGLPFSSEVAGKMHACGHDGHTTILLGTALLLQRLRDRIPGRVRLIFQPGEEANPSGARLMVEKGFLDWEPRMEEIYALHLQPALPLGTVGIRQGAMMASADGITLRALGRGGHAATPHLAVDAIALSAQIINALQYLVSRRLNPVQPVVLSFGTIRGGTRHSVIASEVELQGTLRCVDSDTRSRALELIEETVQSVATGYGGAAELTVRPSQPVTRNHPACVDRVERATVAALGEDRLQRLEHPWMTAEDFNRFSNVIPGAIFWLGTGVGDDPPPLHSSKMAFPEEVMAAGIRLFSHIAADFFGLTAG